MDEARSARSRFERFRDELERCVADVLSTAKSARQAPEAWRALFGAWTTTPPEGLVTDSGAAHPSEVREVLVGVVDKLIPRLESLAHHIESSGLDDHALDDELWELRHRRLDDLVSVELIRYTREVAPPPSIGSIFASSQQRAQQAPAWSVERPRVTVMTCRACGAPRLKETLYGNCPFCDAPLFPSGA